MLTIKDSVRFARTSSALSLTVAALCFLIANLVDPAWAPGARAYLDEIAAAPNRYQGSAVLNALGATVSVFGLIGVLHLLRGRRVTLGQLGAGLILVLWVLDGARWLINLVETAGAQDDPNRALTLLTAASQSPWAVLVDIAAVCGLFLGPVLLAVEAWRRRVTPIWVPITPLMYPAVTFIPGGGNRCRMRRCVGGRLLQAEATETSARAAGTGRPTARLTPVTSSHRPKTISGATKADSSISTASTSPVTPSQRGAVLRCMPSNAVQAASPAAGMDRKITNTLADAASR